MNYLIVGASSGLGRELSYVYAKNKNNLIICSRKEDDLNALKSDIENRYKVKVTVLVLDLTSQDEVEKKLTSNKELVVFM
jgi:short-subunit dehydrogenase